MSRRRDYEVRAYVGRELHERVVSEMLARNERSLSSTICTLVREYFVLREQCALALGVPTPETAADGKQLGHAMLRQSTEQITAGLAHQSKRIDRIATRLDSVEVKLELMYLGLMIHLPEVPEELRKAAIASAEARQELWLRGVQDRLRERVGGRGTEQASDDVPQDEVAPD